MILLFIISAGLFTPMLCYSVSAVDAVEDSWHTKAPMNYPRHNLGVVAVNGKIYAIGGDQLSPNVSTMCVGFNERYDPKTNKWVVLEPMPTPSSNFHAVAFDGKIYCIGRDLTQVYDISANSWSSKTSYPASRASPIGVHVLDGKIFVILTSFNPTVGCEMYVYDPAVDSWTAKNNLPSDCLIMSSFMLDNKLKIVSGFIEPMRTKVLTYNTNTDKWSEERIIATNFMGNSRSFAMTSGLYAPQKIYIPQTLSRDAQHIDLSNFTSSIFAEANITEINITERSTFTRVYDPVSDIWVNGTGVSTSRMGPGVVVADDVLYVIGGMDKGQSLAVNEQYVPFGYHGTLPSGAAFSLDNLAFMDLLVVVVVVAVVVVLLVFFLKKRGRGKQVKANPDGDSMSSSVVI